MAAGAPVAPVVDIPLSLFSGMDPELSPPDCPEGISPDNQDMVYVPGSTSTRPCLSRLLVNALTGAPIPTVVYQKSYVQPNGQPLTLILDSNGQFWVENVTSAPGVVNALAQAPAGLYAFSVSAFGREYIALSDLLHGQFVPLQFDGTYLDRVSQDGPGLSPTVVDFQEWLAVQFTKISGPGLPGQQYNIAGSPTGATETAGVVTIATAVAHGFYPGQYVFISGVGVLGYNGLYQVGTVPSPTTFTYATSASGLAASGGGQVSLPLCCIGTNLPNAHAAPPINVGDAIILSNTTSGLDNQQAGNPASWPVTSVFQDAFTGNWAIQFNFSLAPASVTIAVTGALGQVTLGGQSAPGPHQVVCMFLTRQGFLTAPSPPLVFVSVGGTQWQVTNLPLGPPNVIARVLGFTGAGGDNFFILPANVTLPNPSNPTGTPIVVKATIIPDNVSTSYVVDVPDTTLFAGLAIDQPGNDLFDQCVLGPCAGFFAYDSRLFPWGEWNKIQNFLNMGFCGGYLAAALGTPLGWTVGVGLTGGTLVNGGPWAGGMCWQITGDGTGAFKGDIFQSAYQDAYGTAILQPNTLYWARLWLENVGGNPAGSVQLNLNSASTGWTAVAVVNLASIPPGGGFVTVAFTAATPAAIPADVTLTLYSSGMANGNVLLVSELEIINSVRPYLDNEARGSYVLNPEAFAQTTGTLGPEDDTSPIRCFSLQRNSVLLKTAEGTHTFQANDSEPSEWTISQLSRSVGSCSLRGGDPGHFGTGDAAEDWDLTFNKNGLYLFAGSEFWKVSQEMQPEIDLLNWAQQQTICVKNDVNTRRAYLLVPTGVASAPNLILVMDYRELDTAQQIASSPPVHISLTGKMICSDLTRKWSRWNIAANSAEVLVRPGNQKQMTFGGGNGFTPGTAAGYGNLYTLSAAKFTDDDYGQMFPYYITYFFLNHEMEQQLGVGAHRKLFKKVCMYVSGIGNIFFTPLVNTLANALPNSSTRQLAANSSPSTALTQDVEWTTGIRGERVAFKIQVSPLPGQTDVQMAISKLIVTVTQDPIAVTRSSRL